MLIALAMACGPTAAGRAGAEAPPARSPTATAGSAPVVALSAAAVALPSAATTGGPPLRDLLSRRRSAREFGPTPLGLAAVAQLLWSAQGVLDDQGHRPTPSAGALYPLEVFLFARRVDGLPAGVYLYQSDTHRLLPRLRGDHAPELRRMALDQPAITAAAACFVLVGHYARTAVKYGARASRYVHLEAGHAAQNMLLSAEAHGLGAVPVGAFDDGPLQQLLGTDAAPLYLIAVGWPAP